MTLAVKPDAAADIHLTEPEAMAKIKAGQRVLLDDGRLQARVAAVARELVTLAIEVGGTLLPNKGINLPDTELHIPAVTKRDRDAIALALSSGRRLACPVVRARCLGGSRIARRHSRLRP